MPRANSADKINDIEINEKYLYTSSDVVTLLGLRIQESIKSGAVAYRDKIKVFASENDKSLENLKQKLINEKLELGDNTGMILVAHRVKNDHWVGILLSLEQGGNISRAQFLSSMSKKSPDLQIEQDCFNMLSQHITDIFPPVERSGQITPNTLVNILGLSSPDEYNSAVCVIENLCKFALNSAINNHTLIRSFRMHHAKLMEINEPEIAPNFYRVPSNLEDASILIVNSKYLYSHEDANKILASRLQGLIKNSPQNFNLPVSILQSVSNVDNLSLVNALDLEVGSTTGERIAIIPCNLETSTSESIINYWVGLFVNIDKYNQVSKITIINSLECFNEHVRDDTQIIFDELRKNHSWCQFQFGSCALKATELFDSAPVMIENLLMYAQNIRFHGAANAKKLRLTDLIALQNNMRVYFMSFYAQQLNRANVEFNPQSDLNVVSKDIDSLFKTLTALENNAARIFSNDIIPQETISRMEIEQNYHTVYDRETHTLKLQITKAAELSGVARVFNTKPIKSLFDFATVYGTSIGGGVVAGGVGALGGGGVGVAVVAAEALALNEVFVLGPALVAINPLVFAIPAIVIGLGVGGSLATRSFFSRDFAFVVQQAFNLLKEAKDKDDEKLKTADGILQHQFGGSNEIEGRNLAARWLRYFSTTTFERCFAMLLIAHIRAKREESDCLEHYESVYNYSDIKSIQAMALIGMISVWSQNKWALTLKGIEVTATEKNNKIDEMVSLLNNEHKETIQCYFNNVWQSLQLMLSILESIKYLKSAREFESVRSHIESIQSFLDLHCLKYMEPHGRIAEIVFTFAQGMSYVLFEHHYKYRNNVTQTKELAGLIADKNQQAAIKFSAAQNLINSYRSCPNINASLDVQNTMELMQKFIEVYLQQVEDLAVDKQQNFESVVASKKTILTWSLNTDIEKYNNMRSLLGCKPGELTKDTESVIRRICLKQSI
jgi:hypothetical protein